MQLWGLSRGTLIKIALVVVVLAAAVLSTKRVDIEVANLASEGAFDPAVYAESKFDTVVAPGIADAAIDLADLLVALDSGADPAEFGNTPGAASSFSFPVTFTGVAGEVDGSVLPITVDGVASDIAVQVQIGPALNGTALRDVTGTISFDEFTNQIEYQQVGTQLNNIVKSKVLATIDSTTLGGSTLRVVGAFTRVNPKLVSVVPVLVEIGP